VWGEPYTNSSEGWIVYWMSSGIVRSRPIAGVWILFVLVICIQAISVVDKSNGSNSGLNKWKMTEWHSSTVNHEDSHDGDDREARPWPVWQCKYIYIGYKQGCTQREGSGLDPSTIGWQDLDS